MKKGLFLTFEGVDGCGKSTQMRMITEYLQEQGIEFVMAREPGGCYISERIRDILLDVKSADMNDMTEVLLYAASRVQLVDQVILPALSEGKIVLCDRYIDSSIAYQGFGRKVGKDTVLKANSYAVEYCMPDITFFFDCRPKNAFSRMNPNKVMDRLEQESAEFFKRVYEGYLDICKQNPERVRRIDVSGTKYETRDKMRAIMKQVLKQWMGE